MRWETRNAHRFEVFESNDYVDRIITCYACGDRCNNLVVRDDLGTYILQTCCGARWVIDGLQDLDRIVKS